ncbi:PASTA domain-containing protein [Nocardioides pakistanensis]|jgi:hypothetical protein
MSEPNWGELLERTADRTAVGPAPLASIRAGVARRRRRRALAVAGASAAAVVAVIGATAVLTPAVAPQSPRPPATTDGPAPIPDGTRLVGLGNLAIAVPEEWGTNRTRCGTPMKDTVVINVGVVESCAIARPAGVESVELVQGEPRFDFEVDSTITVDGEEAQRQRTTCTRETIGEVRVCSGTVYFPDHETWFRAESSTGPGEVDRTLDQIRLVPDEVGVPAFQPLAVNAQGRSGERYVARLTEQGFDVEVQTRTISAGKPGYVLDASPAPGTMLPPGSTVTITVIAEPAGPADEVSVGVGTDSDDDREQFATDEQIRAGDTTLHLRVGERIWAYAHGKRANTLAGDLQGQALTVDDWTDGPNYPHAWIATTPGRAVIALSIEADGDVVDLGRVTVVVE